MITFCRAKSALFSTWLPRGLLSLLIVGGAMSASAFGQGISAPPAGYFLIFPAFYDGQYVATQQALVPMSQGAIKNPAAGGFWIDSICYETMHGECDYHMGRHALAMKHYENALRLAINFNSWMLRVQFPLVVTPAPPQQLRFAPWYVTQRQTVVGNYPPTMNIMQGNINNNQAIVQGGVVSPPVLMPLYAQEIVRCTCLAIRRWRELLGPACPHSQVTRDLVQALSARPTLPNHWSEAWIDTELGLAYAAAGKVEQARKTLSNAELASGAFDHAFTGTVLLQLGMLDFEAGDYKSAQRHFLESSWAAANFLDYGVIEEALRYGALTHFLDNNQQPYAPLAAATTWAAAQGMGHLNASLLLSAADNLSQLNQPAAAATSLTMAAGVCARTNMLLGKIGARMNHLNALVAYQSGHSDAGDTALAAAMTFQSGGSLWMFHIGLVDLLWTTNDITDRVAVDLYSKVLRDPTPTDWLTDPLESLSVLSVPHSGVYEHWFEAALLRKLKEHELALQIADMARRHRFLTTLDEGGRLLNLRWLLEAPEKALDQSSLLQRQAILARYPAYNEKSQQARKLRADLQKLPLLPDDEMVAEQQEQMLTALATLSGEQELILRRISVAREPANLVFPPLRPFKQVQESLSEGQTLLVFFTTNRYIYTFLVSKDKYNYTEIKLPKLFQKNVVSMLQKWGNFEQNKEMKLDELVSEAWKAPAQQIMNTLVKSSKADFTKTLNELIIVPDGQFWYIPFEALPVTEGNHTVPLINKVRIRYAPTVGLAVGETRRRRPGGNLAVALGRLYPRDDPALIDREFEDIAGALPVAEAIRGKLPAHGAIYGSLFDRLIVLNEVVPATTAYDWSPLQIDNRSSGGTLAQWLSLPFGGPDQVLLPGFRTAAERAMTKSSKDANGNDLFLSICGLMASGTRTVLISRWRTGGQTSVDLVREFAQELPHTTASDAWQRSVQLVTNSQIHPMGEPRIKLTTQQEPPKADHPFFWAGYLLADTGALPMTDDEEEAAENVLIAVPAGEKPAADKPAQPKPNPKAMDQDPDLAAAKKGGKEPDARKDEKGGAIEVAAEPQADDAAAADEEDAPKIGKGKRARPPRGDQKKPPANGKAPPA